jgi:hypothetical protein
MKFKVRREKRGRKKEKKPTRSKLLLLHIHAPNHHEKDVAMLQMPSWMVAFDHQEALYAPSKEHGCFQLNSACITTFIFYIIVIKIDYN